MQNLSLLTSLSKAHLHVEQFPRSICLTLAVDFEHLKEQKKEEKRKKKRNQQRDQQPWWEAEGEETSPHYERLPHGGEINQLGQKRTFGGSKENTRDFGRQDKVRTAHMIYTTALSIPA